MLPAATPQPYSLARRPSSFGYWLRLALADILSLLALGGAALAFAVQPPARTPLFPLIPVPTSTSDSNRWAAPDPQYAYPWQTRTVPSWAAGVLAVGAPAAVALLLPLARPRRLSCSRFWDAEAALFGAATAVLAASVLQAAVKWAVGGAYLRPHFYDRCRPDPSLLLLRSPADGVSGGKEVVRGTGTGTGYMGIMYTTEICTRGRDGGGDDADLRDAASSFPSGHAASVFAGMLFLALYLNAKLKVLGPGGGGLGAGMGVGIVALLLPLLAACLVCASLAADHSHHGRDLVAGAAIGALCALVAFRARYAALWDYRYNHVPLNRTRAYGYGNSGGDGDEEDGGDDGGVEEEREERPGGRPMGREGGLLPA
ncbi:hypothetical protein SLS62_010109 [Diatrype stigma]|uniref:Phosphatidic acid phosphatase type 2/haloperoxidase domain-containing protein n=1 Tax=Diatrype stigma TaxID=117547 RepID=A0AAN9UAU6_9PEZI